MLLPKCNLKLAPSTHGGKERWKKGWSLQISIGGSFNEQGNKLTRLVSGVCKMSSFLQPPTRILKVYIDALAGFNQRPSPDSLNTIFLSPGCVLGAAPGKEEGRWEGTFQSQGKRRRLQLPGSSSWVNDGHVFLMTSWNILATYPFFHIAHFKLIVYSWQW